MRRKNETILYAHQDVDDDTNKSWKYKLRQPVPIIIYVQKWYEE